MSKFTEGPWSLDRYGSVVDANFNTIKIVGVALPGRNDEEALANRDLFLAAPDLLEAMLMVRDSTAVLNHLDSEAQQFICDTIKKALGQA